MKSFKQFVDCLSEDIPANNAGSGSVAGLGSEPPVSVKGQKAHKKKTETMTSGITAGRKIIAPVGMEGY
jgi:hypothetical protein